MRVVIQRVSEASVIIRDRQNPPKASIGNGLLVLLGIETDDTAEDTEWLCSKIIQLRIFNDEEGVMNRSVMEIDGEILVVSQFTLHASTRKGNRPSYIRAARPELAIPLYEQFCAILAQKTGKAVQTGEFGADMQVQLINEGPVTILMDSKNRE